MKILASELCERNTELKDMLGYREPESKAIEIYDEAINLSKRGENAYNLEQYYSSASYCFGSNVKLNQVFLETKNFSTEKYNGLFEELRKSIIKVDNELDKKDIETITDLESYMVVKERLIEALDYTNITGNSSFTYAYAYANERLRSAYSWYKFFGHDSKVLELNEDSLRESCRQRIAEAEERIQYASIYLPFNLDSQREELDKAYDDYNDKNFALCLFKASKAKAESNIILNTIGVDKEYLPRLVYNKLKAAAKVILKADKKDIFPILGYSYYEYASNLKDNDIFSSLLYSEYALELSNLDIYFKEKGSFMAANTIYNNALVLIIGLLLGFLLGLLIKRKKS
jgi:predicted S18 family serine protease